MSALKQVLKRRITSIEKIIKITEAMEVVSLFRLKKAERNIDIRHSRFEVINNMVEDLSKHLNYAPHEFFSLKESKKPLLICIGSDKGLCGGFNLFIINRALEFKKEKDAKVIIYGRRLHPLKRHFGEDVLEFNSYSDYEAEELAKKVFEGLKNKEFDGLYVIYNQFKLNILGKPQTLKVLPLDKKEKEDRDFIWEGENIWDDFFFTYIKEAIETFFLDSQAAEEFMRVFTMKQAKDNAQDLNKRIGLEFHKLRQSMITKELTDLCAALR